ncbi:MAG TPA: hypothetical protein VEF76_01160 [Patescibacteria group bacterium]|nr:hypothetical protein [Patescibacteria group bacterium]
MSLHKVFAKLLGRQAPVESPPPEPETGMRASNPTMDAIRASDLHTAMMLMEKGGEVDFSDPAIETQMRVATYEAHFGFLQALETRRAAQEKEARQKQQALDILAVQEEKGRHLQKMAGIATVIYEGADEVAAPKTARFRRRIPAA